MSATAGSVTTTSEQNQSQPTESPEIVSARAKSSEAGYARNRAEATYNAAKKEHGEKSGEAQAAKKGLETAQAEVEKAQGVLRDLLKLVTKAPVAKTPKAEKPKEAKPSPKAAPQSPAPSPSPSPSPSPESPPKAVIIQRHYELLERRIEILPLKNRAELKKRLEKLLKEIESEPKTLEYYRKQLKNLKNGEMALPRHGAYLETVRTK